MVSITKNDISNKYDEFRNIFSEIFEQHDEYIEYINLKMVSKKSCDNNYEIIFEYDWYDKHDNKKIRKVNFLSFNYYYNKEQKMMFKYNCSYFPFPLYLGKPKLELINLLNNF